MNKGIEAALYPRHETECLILPMPRLEGEELRSYMEYKLRALYPGNGEDYEISVHPLGKTGNAAVYIRDKETQPEGSKKVLPAALYSGLFRKNRSLTILTVSHGWVDLIHYPADNPDAAESRVFSYKQSYRIRDFLESRTDEIQTLEIYYSDPDFLNHILPFLEIPSIVSPVVMELKRRKVWKADTAFTNLNHKPRIPASLVQALLLVLIIGFNLTGLFREKEILEHRLMYLEEEYKVELQQRKEILQLEEERSQKQILWEEAKSQIPGNRYNFLHDLSIVFKENYEIETLLINGHRFSMDLVGPNALSLKEKFNQDHRFSKIKISQVVPEDGIERFKLQGEYHD